MDTESLAGCLSDSPSTLSFSLLLYHSSTKKKIFEGSSSKEQKRIQILRISHSCIVLKRRVDMLA